MKELYVCYDGVENECSYHESEQDAISALKVLVEESMDGGEWMEGIENSFVAEIKHKVNMIDNVELSADLGYPCYDMVISEIPRAHDARVSENKSANGI
jgi:hypothetical protein